MTQNASVEDRISRWLIEEATFELPDRVLQATFEQTRRLPRRRSSWQAWRLRRTGPRLAIVMGALVIALIGVARPFGDSGEAGSHPSGLPSPSATPSAVATSVPADAKVFLSPRGYSIALTTDWSVSSGAGSWDGVTGGTTGPSAQVAGPEPGTDFYLNRDPSEWIEVGIMAVHPGTTLEQWVASEVPRALVPGCGFSPPGQPVTLGGGAVITSHATCGTLAVTNAYLQRGSNGILIQWGVFPADELAEAATFQRALESFAFR